MRTLIKNISWAGLFVLLTAQLAQAFSLIGPGVGGGVAGDKWEQPVIGYGLGGDVGTPKNLGEEYRRVTPVMYYASDASFINFFGLAGLTNIDEAFALYNGPMCGQTNASLFLYTPTNGTIAYNLNDPYTGSPLVIYPTNNLDSYPMNLPDFPLEAQQLNYTAQAAGLTDLKSSTMNLIAEQLGLSEPERFTWTLHDRDTIAPGACPADTEYLVVQRNFDIINSPLNQLQYSPYVNGTLYTFIIEEFCTGPNPLAETIPIPVDIFADTYTTVASLILPVGGFYTSLTRDDVAGLQYLLTTNNINYEVPSAAGGLLLSTNVQLPQLFGPTLPLSLLFAQAQITDPNTLQGLYPGLTYISVATNIVDLVATNFSIYITNLPPPYTNSVPLSNGVAYYPPGGTVVFTNWSPVQFADAPILLTTLPLAPLLYDAQFLSPAELLVLYPDLLIDTVQTNFFSVEIDTNTFAYYTNQSVAPVFSNSATGLRLPIVGVLTNIYYFTNQPGPTILSYDNTSFLTITTLDLATFSDASVTNDPATMQALYPGLEILNYSAFPTILYVTNFVSYLTNYTGAPFGSPPVAVTLAVSTNAYLGTVYTYNFGNVFTNHFYTNRLVLTQNIWTTNAGIGSPVGSPFFTVTNYTLKTKHRVSGDFFIIPTNWCGFDLLLSTRPNINPPYAYGPTNSVIFQGYNSGGATGTNNVAGGNSFGLTQNTFDIYTNYLYAVRPGICEPVLQFGTNYTTNIISTYSYNFLNVITNHYYTNSLVSLFITNIYLIPGGSPNTLGTNITMTNFYVNLPSGDFYLVPPTWCGYQIEALLTNYIVPTNIVFTNASFGTGTITNQQYTFVEYLSYTNYTYSIRPGTCEPALGSSTNYSTNIVTQYSYYFGNIVTNHYFTNGPVTVITTNIAAVTNGLVGMLTNVVATNIFYNGVGGDFYIIPPADCDFAILATQLTTVVTTTNTLIATNFATFGDPVQYSQTTVSSYTNSTFLIQPSTCATAPAPAALRQGVERVAFIRANYDSLLGQFFQPLTNYYTMVMITNSQMKTEYYQRVVVRPDILIEAQDLASGSSALPVVGSIGRNLNFDQSQILPGLAGPGIITNGTVFTYDKVGNIYANGPTVLYGLTTNAFLNEYTEGSEFGISNRLSVLAWAYFDSTTNDPVIYPNGESIQDVVNQLYLQVTPSTVPDGTDGVAYTPVTFSATGGQPPYIWAAPNLSGLVPGLSFNAATATLSGTPTASGTFSFTVQLTDSVNRVINLNYSITIH
jgi:hypothetical protein